MPKKYKIDLDKIRQAVTYENVNEFILVLEGAKPCLRIHRSFIDTNLLAELCAEYGVSLLEKDFDNFYGSGEKITILYLAVKKRSAQLAYEAERKEKRLELGKWLGYPECCVKFFYDTLHSAPPDLGITPRHIFDNSRGLHYINNNLYNFNGRKLMLDESHPLEFYRWHIITHEPCSYDCVPSIKLGKEYLRILKKYDPEFVQDIKIKLTRPALWIDSGNCLVFDGVISGSSVSYQSLERQLSYCMDSEYMKSAALADQIKITGKNLYFFSRGKKISHIAVPGAPILFQFNDAKAKKNK